MTQDDSDDDDDDDEDDDDDGSNYDEDGCCSGVSMFRFCVRIVKCFRVINT